MGATTPGLVCGHHHLYSALARGMPAPPKQPAGFIEILEQVWWRLDVALDEEMIRWSAMLGAAEALMCGTTGIIDHHESPSPSTAACRSSPTPAPRWACASTAPTASPTVTVRRRAARASPRTSATSRRRPRDGRRPCGVHLQRRDPGRGRGTGRPTSASACTSTSPRALPIGCRRPARAARHRRLAARPLRHLDRPLRGTIAHNPRIEHEQLGRLRGARPDRSNRVVLGTDGIGADMLEEFRLAYVRLARDDVHAGARHRVVLAAGGVGFFPECRDDRVDVQLRPCRHRRGTSRSHRGSAPLDVTLASGEVVVRDGTRPASTLAEVRAKAAEQATRLFAKL